MMPLTRKPIEEMNDRVPPRHIGIAAKSTAPKRSPICLKIGHVGPSLWDL